MTTMASATAGFRQTRAHNWNNSTRRRSRQFHPTPHRSDDLTVSVHTCVIFVVANLHMRARPTHTTQQSANATTHRRGRERWGVGHRHTALARYGAVSAVASAVRNSARSIGRKIIRREHQTDWVVVVVVYNAVGVIEKPKFEVSVSVDVTSLYLFSTTIRQTNDSRKSPERILRCPCPWTTNRRFVGPRHRFELQNVSAKTQVFNDHGQIIRRIQRQPWEWHRSPRLAPEKTTT